jgi:PHYB activation tagged suppressor 1
MITNDANGNYRGHHNATINFNTFVPFGGNRICLGWNLACMITKLLLSMMLLHFNFSISPSYHHSPCEHDINLWPEFGVQLLIRNVESNIKH